MTVNQVPSLVPYNLATAFAGDASFAASSDTDVVTVIKEDCVLTVPLTVNGSASSPTTLPASFGENDPYLGNLSGKTISFTGVNTSTNAAVGPFSSSPTQADGGTTALASLTEGVYEITAHFATDAYYNACDSLTFIVTVAPAAFKVTGGGWISNTTGRTSFGFNAKSDVAGLHGQIQIRVKDGKDKFHGDVVLTLSGNGNTATWTGTGKWDGVNGYQFTVTVVDNGTSGKKGDTINIVVKTPNGNTTVFTTNGAQALKGGNIVVH